HFAGIRPPAEPPQGRPAPPSGGGERSELGGSFRPPAEPPQGRPAPPSGGGERSELGGPSRPPAEPPQGRPAPPSGGGERSELGGTSLRLLQHVASRGRLDRLVLGVAQRGARGVEVAGVPAEPVAPV